MSDQGRDGQAITFPETDGEGTDGRGTAGIIDEKNREAEAAEAPRSPRRRDGFGSVRNGRQRYRRRRKRRNP